MSAKSYVQAIEDFRRVRRQAIVQEALAGLTGTPKELLSYDEVRQALKVERQVDKGLQEIPVEAIVGSVGRYRDFTRGFLPRSDKMESRWARVKSVATDVEGPGWPPIEVYQIGEAYFVLDGNHRVSVARQLGMTHIMAHVTEVKTKVPLSAGANPDELICKARYAAFLERTRLDETRPQADFSASAPGAYRVLDEQIALHQYYLSEDAQKQVSFPEAAADWYGAVYAPTVQVIREKGLLHDFPGRTETDLYAWLVKHRDELRNALAWEIAADSAAEDLVAQHSASPQRKLARLGEKVRGAILPDEFEPGPPPGVWRTQHLAGRQDERLFRDLLVPLSGEEVGWRGLEQALVVAQKEGSTVRGLHIVGETDADGAGATTAVHNGMAQRFADRCREAGVNGRLLFETGPVARTVCDRARWNDLVVLNMLHPPGTKTLDRLSSGLRQIIQRCPRPVLVAPQTVSPLRRALLAYDGQRKAEEALFLAAYLAARWTIPLVVVTAAEKDVSTADVAAQARRYLADHGLEATFVVETGAAVDVILATAAAHGCDFIIMGGYGATPMFEAILGSTANKVLRRTEAPVLICQ